VLLHGLKKGGIAVGSPKLGRGITRTEDKRVWEASVVEERRHKISKVLGEKKKAKSLLCSRKMDTPPQKDTRIKDDREVGRPLASRIAVGWVGYKGLPSLTAQGCDRVKKTRGE